jgi:hypothetical protein
LETTAVLADLGHGNDPRLARAMEFVLSKQDARCRWKLENSLNGTLRVWVDIEEKRKPSKWITLRVLRLLKRVAQA